MAHNYWTATDDIQRELGGHNPSCPSCGEEMFPIDDHGRFRCVCGKDPASREREKLLNAMKKIKKMS